MNLESRIYPSPSSAPLPGGESPDAISEKTHLNHADLLTLNEARLLSYITGDLLDAERSIYGVNDAEAKIVFLGGGPTHNIAKAVTFEGTPVYSSTPEFAKWSEMFEFMGAANRYTDNKGTLPEFISEVADVVYNLAVLSKIDDYEHAPDYTELIELVASTLGWSPREALLVAAAKYHQRFIHACEKDSAREDELMERLLQVDIFLDNASPIVSSPSRQQVSDAFDLGTDLLSSYLAPRYHQIRFQKQRSQFKDQSSS